MRSGLNLAGLGKISPRRFVRSLYEDCRLTGIVVANETGIEDRKHDDLRVLSVTRKIELNPHGSRVRE